MDTGIRRMISATTVRGALTEAVWITAHLALYPLGFLEEKARAETHQLPTGFPSPNQETAPATTSPDRAGTPILLVHGMVDNRSVFTVLRRALRKHGFNRVRAMNYSVFTSDVRAAAAQLGRQIEALCADTGYERIHIVGHSMGGIVARYYVQRLGGADRVHTLVTLGSPHSGTQLARLAPLPLARQLRPNSEIMKELAEPAPGCPTRFVAVWSDLDQLMVPTHSGRIDHQDLIADNICVTGIGHMSLPVDRRVAQEVAAALAYLDPEGHTVTAGVTSLDNHRRPTTGKPPEHRPEMAQEA
jgi:pimeloyl-ACP methyl ester carboxylesterase